MPFFLPARRIQKPRLQRLKHSNWTKTWAKLTSRWHFRWALMTGIGIRPGGNTGEELSLTPDMRPAIIGMPGI